MISNLGQYSKAIIAAIGLVLLCLTAIPTNDLPAWVPSLIAVLTAVSVYVKANTPGSPDA